MCESENENIYNEIYGLFSKLDEEEASETTEQVTIDVKKIICLAYFFIINISHLQKNNNDSTKINTEILKPKHGVKYEIVFGESFKDNEDISYHALNCKDIISTDINMKNCTEITVDDSKVNTCLNENSLLAIILKRHLYGLMTIR